MTFRSDPLYVYMFVVVRNNKLPYNYAYRNDDGIYCCKVTIAASSLFEAAIMLHEKNIKIIECTNANKTD